MGNDATMRFNDQFKNEKELLDFVLNNTEFDDWETTFILLKSNIGMEITASTRISDPSGLYEFVLWKDAKTLARNFTTIYTTSGAYIDIRLRAPKRVKDLIDKNNDFKQFSFSFYAERGNVVAQNTALERTLPAEVEPLDAWDTYALDLITKWQTTKTT
jgi:hypothetical protein